MRNARMWLWGLLPLLLLWALATLVKQPAIEADLTRRADAAVAAQGQSWAKAEVAGRDVALAAVAPSNEGKSRALAIFAEVFGVRLVSSRGEVKAPPPASVSPPPPPASASAPPASASPPPASASPPPASVAAPPSSLPVTAAPAPLPPPPPFAAAPAASSAPPAATAPPGNTAAQVVVRAPDAASAGAQECAVRVREAIGGRAVHFETSMRYVRAESLPLLRGIAAALRDCAKVAVAVEGHTDSDGGDRYNKNLSEKRAAEVVKALTAAGAPGATLTSAGFGEDKPVAPNSTRDSKAKNRRVEIIIR